MRVCIDTFIDAEDSVVGANGKRYYFEFHEMFGPTLTDKKGNILKRQPVNERHPFWKPFNEWNLQRIRLRHSSPKGRA